MPAVEMLPPQRDTPAVLQHIGLAGEIVGIVLAVSETVEQAGSSKNSRKVPSAIAGSRESAAKGFSGWYSDPNSNLIATLGSRSRPSRRTWGKSGLTTGKSKPEKPRYCRKNRRL